MTVNYTINKTDGSIFATVPQNTVVTQAGLSLIGKNYVAFGETLNENLVHITENFASATQPSGSLTGQLWYDKSAKSLKVFSGSQYNSLLSGTFQVSAPTSPYANQFWFNTSSSKLYVYNAGAFRLIGPNGDAETQVLADTIIDTGGTSHKVLRILVNNKNFGIITDETFVPASAQIGFKNAPPPVLAPGLNLGNDTTMWANKVRGIATSADALEDSGSLLTASNIVRNNVSGSILGSLNVYSGVTVSASAAMQFLPDVNDLRINNTGTNGDIYLQSTNSGGLQSTVTIKGGSQRVGIGTTLPATMLHVAGGLQIDGTALFQDVATGVTPSTNDDSTKFATTAYVKAQFNDTVLTGGPTATGTLLSSDNSNRLATTTYVKSQFVDTDLTGIPTAPYISNLSQSDNQIANTQFVQDVTAAILASKADVSVVTGIDNRVIAIEGNYARLNGNTFTGTHNFTGATVTVATPSASTHAATKAYVDLKANINSPVFTGTPASTTPAAGDNSTKIATTAWVQNEGYLTAGTLGISVEDESVLQGSALAVDTVNFTGAGVVATVAGSTATVTIDGGVPVGVITMWYGIAAAVPVGWSICDGTNGTPDLRDKFVIGAGSTYAKGSTGGSASTTSASGGAHDHGGATGETVLTVNQIPAHSHRLWSWNQPGDTDGTNSSLYNNNFGVVGPTTPFGHQYLTNSYNDTGTQLIENTGGGLGHSHTIASAGAHTHTVSTLPPYHALYYIMKL